jgi:SAM-dependent methyltransferase
VCQVCRTRDWYDLPDPASGRCVTTAGRMLNESLGKAQCARCGFVQRTRAQFLGSTDYYERHYAEYYDRPGTARFHAERYRVVADWMAAAQPFTPRRILDVGCGQGWTMDAMRARYPGATIEGVEPSHFNGSAARKRGFAVYESRVGDGAMPEERYDLVYCNNVIQHVTNARNFVASLTQLMADDGAIVITCPDGSLPNIEILWADQNFSFLPVHLVQLAGDIGLGAIRWYASPESPSVPPAQMLVLSHPRSPADQRHETQLPVRSLPDLYDARCDYLNAFQTLDEYLFSRTRESNRVFNLGASYWSSVLAAYCPTYWETVSACVVDDARGGAAAFSGKEVIDLSSVSPQEHDALVFGTSPTTHRALEDQFARSWNRVVTWDGGTIQY